MQRKQTAAIAAVLIALAIAASILALWPGQKGLVVENVLIEYGNVNPFELFAMFSENDVFLVSPQMNEKAKTVDHQMFNATALFLQVLEGNNRKTVQLLRVYSEESELSYCLTNYGDVNRSETLEKGECLQLLSSENGGLILIEFPDSKLPGPVLEIGEKRLVVKPKTNDDIGNASFLALRIMFKNSQQIIEKSNIIIGTITG